MIVILITSIPSVQTYKQRIKMNLEKFFKQNEYINVEGVNKEFVLLP